MSQRRTLLSISQILSWADAHRERTGVWPTLTTPGSIAGTLDEKWSGVDRALRRGKRGLPAGSSLARLLAKHRDVRNQRGLPALDARQILGWASAHFHRTNSWPTRRSGAIVDAPGEENWRDIDGALGRGLRGLPGGSSLARLLSEWRQVRNLHDLPALTEAQILRWADAHFQRQHSWPKNTSGPIVDAPGETWSAVDAALRVGVRGCEGGSSLAQLLAQERHVPNFLDTPPLTVKQILIWADAHYRKTGLWPTYRSGPIVYSRGETWQNVDSALRRGARGLPKGLSLARLLREQRGRGDQRVRPCLTLEQIHAWAQDHVQRTGRWPTGRDGPIPAAPGETWSAVNAALKEGLRGLPGGTSLCQLFGRRGRGIPGSAENGEKDQTGAVSAGRERS